MDMKILFSNSINTVENIQAIEILIRGSRDLPLKMQRWFVYDEEKCMVTAFLLL